MNATPCPTAQLAREDAILPLINIAYPVIRASPLSPENVVLMVILANVFMYLPMENASLAIASATTVDGTLWELIAKKAPRT